MRDRRPAADFQFDEDLERVVRGERPARAPAPGAEGYAEELAAARSLAAELAPLREPPAEVCDRIWRRTQERIEAQGGRRPPARAGAPSLVRFPVRRLVAVAAAVALLLGAISPAGQHALGAAQEIIEEIVKAPHAGNDVEVVPGNEDVDDPHAVEVPYDPTTEGEIEPVGDPAENQ